MSSTLHQFHGHHLPFCGSKEEPLYAVGSRFDTPDKLIAAVTRLSAVGYTRYACFTPYPVHGLPEAMHLPKSILSFLVLGGGFSAILIALSLQLIPTTLIYPIVVGGKPLDLSALPQYIPITVALTLMISAIVAVTGMILLGGMPRLNHPMLAWELFAKSASRGFFLTVEARDKSFNMAAVTELLHTLGATVLIAIHEEAEAQKTEKLAK